MDAEEAKKLEGLTLQQMKDKIERQRMYEQLKQEFEKENEGHAKTATS